MDVFDLVATIQLNLDEFDRNLNAASSKFNDFSKNLSSVGKGMSDLLSPAVEGFQAVEGVGQKTADVVKKGLTGFAAAATAVGGFGVSAVKAGMSFDSSMSEVSAISGATGQEFEDLRNKALEMGAKTKFSASEAASAMTYMGMAGWKAGDMIGGIEGIMNLAAASGEDLATTSDIVTDALTAFGLKASDSGHFADVLAAASTNANTNVGMLGETFKYAAPVAGALGFSVEDVAVAAGLMANSGIKASQAGTSLRSIFSAMTGPIDLVGAGIGEVTIATQNADGSMRDLNDIVADLRVAFGGMTEAEKASNAEAIAGKYAMSGFLAMINASEEDVSKLTDAINDCNGAAEEMSKIMVDNLQGDLTLLGSAFESLQIAISDALTPTLREFAQFGQNAMVELLSGFQEGGTSGFMSALSGVVTEGVTMLAEKAPEFAQISMEFVTALGEGLINAAPQVLSATGEIINILVSGLSDFLGGHSSEMVEIGGNIIEMIASGFQEAGGVIADHIGEFVPLIAEGFLKYHETLFTVGIEILGAIGKGIVENKDQIQSMASETIKNIATALSENAPDIIEGAIALLDALVSAIGENMPLIMEVGGQIIGEIANGISGSLPALLVVAATIVPYIAKAIDVVTSIGGTIKNVIDLVSGGIDIILGVGSKLIGGIQALWGLIAANPVVAVIAAIIAVIVLLWTHCEGFREFFINLWEGLKDAVSAFVEFFLSVWDGVKEFFSELWDGLKEIVAGFGEWLGEKIAAIVEFFRNAWEGVTEFFSGLWEGLKEVVSAFGEWIGEKMAGIVEWVKEKWDGIQEFFAGIWEGVKEIFQGVADFFGEVFQAAADVVQAAWDAVVSFFSAVFDGIVTVFSTIADVLGEFFSAAAEAVQAVWEGVSAFFQSVWEGIKAVFEPVAEILGGFFQAAWELVQSVWEAAKEFFSGVGDAIKSVFEGVTQFLGDTFRAAWDAVQAAWSTTTEFFSGILNTVQDAASEAGENTGKALRGAWETAKDAWSAATGFFSGVLNTVQDAASEAGENTGKALRKAWEESKSAWEGATEFFSGVKDKIIGVFSGIWDKFKEIGGNIVSGIKDGVLGAWDNFVSFMSDKISGIISSVKEKLGIHSPSKVFAGIGENMALGLSEGWDDEYSSIKRQIERGMEFGTASVGLNASGMSYGGPASNNQPAAQPVSGGNTYVTINSPVAVDGVTAAREWKKTMQQIANSYI